MAESDGARDTGVSPQWTRECFDAKQATGPTCVVPIAAVVDLLEITHAAERIAEYHTAMRCGARFPPVSVVRVGRRFWIADGHKRFTAYRALGASDIVVEVWGWRRWGGDQWRQFRTQTRRQWAVLRAVPTGPAGRAAARRLAGDAARHWRRIVVSWWCRVRRRMHR